MNYQPENLSLWERPDHYAGPDWPDYYVFLGQHRDSDTLERSNFTSALAAIGGETETVKVIRERHWAVGWVEWIAIHKTDSQALEEADEISGALHDYPVVDDEHFSELEYDEAQHVWQTCYDRQERLQYIRACRSQFEFHSMQDLWACVRGEFFNGYASELLY